MQTPPDPEGAWLTHEAVRRELGHDREPSPAERAIVVPRVVIRELAEVRTEERAGW